MKIIINTDGGCRFNSKEEPGVASAAFVAYTEDGQYLASQSAVLTGTNNVAEYQGVLLAAQALPVLLTQPMNGTPVSVEIRCDAMLIVKQMTGQWEFKDRELLRLAEQCQEALRTLGVPHTFVWVPREQNKDADHLCNLALDGQVKTDLFTAFPYPVKTVKATCGQLFRLHGRLPTPRPMRVDEEGYALCNGCGRTLKQCECPALDTPKSPVVAEIDLIPDEPVYPEPVPFFLPWEDTYVDERVRD
jgi:ribonuclease HI